jgi:hypothetical protein
MNKLVWIVLLLGGTAVADPQRPTTKTVKVAAGVVSVGCIAWSSKVRAAACITGLDTKGDGAELQVQYIGIKEPPVSLADPKVVKLDAAKAKAINATLAKHRFTAIGARKQVDPKTPLAAGKTTFTVTETPNRQIKATCGKGTNIHAEEPSAGETAVFYIREAGDDVIIELDVKTTKAKQTTQMLGAWVFDTVACTNRG